MANANEEIIESLAMLEKIKALPNVAKQQGLITATSQLQIQFSKALTDMLTNGPEGLTPDEIAYARKDDRLAAIKMVRNRLGCPMTKAKEMVNEWQKENGVDPSGGQR